MRLFLLLHQDNDTEQEVYQDQDEWESRKSCKAPSEDSSIYYLGIGLPCSSTTIVLTKLSKRRGLNKMKPTEEKGKQLVS